CAGRRPVCAGSHGTGQRQAAQGYRDDPLHVGSSFAQGLRATAMVVSPFVRPSLAAVTVILPVSPALVLTIARASPLKAARSGAWNGSKLVGSPLSVATISPGPAMVNRMRLSARGTRTPFAST